jgi:hypothetical protein
MFPTLASYVGTISGKRLEEMRPMFRQTCIAVLVALAVLCSFTLATAQEPAAGSLENFVKVKKGMSRAEVESLLGKPAEETSGAIDAKKDVRSGISLIVTRGDALSVLNTTMPEKVATDIAKLPQIASIRPGLVSVEAFEELGGDPLLIQGWPEGNEMFGELKLVTGEMLGKKHIGQRAVIVGRELARLKSVKVGDTLTIADERYHVVGTFVSKEDQPNPRPISSPRPL